MKQQIRKEMAKELYFDALNLGKGMISEYLAQQIALNIVDRMNEQTEYIFYNYGIGYMGKAEAINDYTKSNMYKYWQDVKKEIKKL